MAAFRYTAFNKSGRLRRGIKEGDTPRQVRQMLRDAALTPVTIEEIQRAVSSGTISFLPNKQLKPLELSLITRQLATLVRSGTVLEEALRIVAEQNEKSGVKSVLMAVRSKILEGHTFAAALAGFSGSFSNFFRTTVRAGEQAGHLDLVLDRLADYTEFRQHLRQKLTIALLYPSILSFVAIAVVTALMTYVVPQVVKVFENMGQELPALTRWLIATSNFLKSYGLLNLFLIFALLVLLKMTLRNSEAKFRFHKLLLGLPLIGKGVKTLNTARFARSLSILIASGVSVIESLHISSQVISNLALREAVSESASRVREGASLHSSLAKCGFFPPITIHMIASGEASSKLEEMLEHAAKTHEREIETTLATMIGIFEPFLILLLGGIVLVIVLAILMPIFDLNQLITR